MLKVCEGKLSSPVVSLTLLEVNVIFFLLALPTRSGEMYADRLLEFTNLESSAGEKQIKNMHELIANSTQSKLCLERKPGMRMRV